MAYRNYVVTIPLFRRRLRRFLKKSLELQVVGQAKNGMEAIPRQQLKALT